MDSHILFIAGLLLVVSGQAARQIPGLLARWKQAQREKAVKLLLDKQMPIAKAEPVEEPPASNDKMAA